MKKSLKKSLFLTPLMLLIPGMGLVFSQVKVSSQGGTSNQTYNITNTSDGVTTNAVSGTMRVHNRQFIDVLNETGFASAVTVAAVNGYNIRVSNSQPVSANITVPDTVLVEFVGAGKLSINSGITVTLAGGYKAARKRVFFGAGSVKVSSVSSVAPEHFGARNDTTFNSSTAFQKAIDCFPPFTDGVVELSSGSKYLVSSTVSFPLGTSYRGVTIEGNGALVYVSSDTAFLINSISNSANGPSYRRHAIKGITFRALAANKYQGVAVAIQNSVNHEVTRCQFHQLKNGIVSFNTLQTVAGWTEGIRFSFLRFPNCDTGMVWITKGGGLFSFANTQLYDVEFGAGARSDSRKVVHIALLNGARLYTSDFSHVYFALSDSTKGLYSDGKFDGTRGFFRVEGFGANGQDETYGFYFDTNSTNVLVDWFVGYEGMNKMEEFIHNGSGRDLSGIRVQLLGQGSVTNRGMTNVVTGSVFSYLNSVISHDSLAYSAIGAGGVPATSAYDWVMARATTGGMKIRTRGSVPLEFLDHEGGSSRWFAPVKLHDVGERRTINDSTTISVKAADYIFLHSNDGDIDSLKNLTGGYNGQEVLMLFNEDSSVVDNLELPASDGQIFLMNSRDLRTPAGTRMLLKYESDVGDWREWFYQLPMKTATWDPGNIVSGGVDSVNVTYFGAEIGDPVQIGFSSITSAGADWNLFGHVVSADNIRVYLRKNGSGAKDLASGTLRYKVVR